MDCSKLIYRSRDTLPHDVEAEALAAAAAVFQAVLIDPKRAWLAVEAENEASEFPGMTYVDARTNADAVPREVVESSWAHAVTAWYQASEAADAVVGLHGHPCGELELAD